MVPVSPEERRSAIEARYPVWPRTTIGKHFELRGLEFGDRPLLITPTHTFSYAEVWSKSWQLAKSLLAMGVKRRQHVGVLMTNEPEFVFSYIAISIVGAVCIPINTMLRKDELKYILHQSDCEWLLLHQVAGSTPHGRTVTELLNEWQLSGDNHLRQIVCIPNGDEEMDTRFLPWEKFVALSATVLDEQVRARFEASEYPDEVVNIIYTSGSTGVPKGVMITHQMFLRCAFSTTLSRAFENGRRVFTGLPLYHVFALEEGLLAVSFVGGCVITSASFHPHQALQLVLQHEANDFLCVPSMLVAFLHQPEVENQRFPSLYALMCAAAPAPVPVWEEAVKMLGLTEICTGYGGTEVTASTVHTEVGDAIETVVTRVGRIKPAGSSGLPEYGGANVEYKVVDPETGTDLEPGLVGELTARGNIVTRGYYKNAEETALAVDKDGWLRTGDLGRIDEQGYIEFLGRSKELIKVSGENVSPKEIEEVLTLHPAVAQAYVVGVEDRLTAEAAAAFVQLKPGARCTRRELIEWCQSRLARFKVPRHCWFVDGSEWPMTGTGKIQKFLLRDMAMERLAANRSS